MNNRQKIAVMTVLTVITAYYFFINPSEMNFGIRCLFFKTTGLYCPGCGGQRAFHAFLHGDFYEAFQDNLLIFMVLPLIVLKFLEEIFNKKLLPNIIYSTKFLIPFIVFVVIFTVLRNLPAFNQFRP
jgi:hypothetical protein